ncbi:sulfatase-like hydrolase/transferase [Geminicoccaceae bacterium 1502E]|nr:sulfatase-like hydrolase/transferase [Geminicoccaceae bacterium 1502E]
MSLGLDREAEAARRKPMNIILFLTDQERAIQHFPEGWAEQNLPGMQRLQQNGLTFENAFCSSCMCSPSRASLLTGLFPAQHQVKDTLTFGMEYSDLEQELPRNVPNLATIMRKAGYDVVYKGKWHTAKPLSDPQTENEALLAWEPRDLAVYGFDRWTEPDAGENQNIVQFGGGTANNDERYMTGETLHGPKQEGVLDYLRSVNPRKPFCLIVSLVNPHDVLAYPRTWKIGGYESDDWIQGDIGLPETWDEDLSTKPTVQQQFLDTLKIGLGPLPTEDDKRAYVNFYGNLLKHIDAYLVDMLDVLEEQDLLEDTLVIRSSDHGEMAMAHGGMRQKMFNAYEESLRVPLIYSNPRLYPQPRRSDALVSHVDLLPTLADFLGMRRRRIWEGVSYAPLLLDPAAPAPQDHVLYTYDDIRAGQDTDQLVDPPNRIVTIREGRWKLSRYFDADGNVPDQWEMYDLQEDPLERDNLARPGYRGTQEQTTARFRLKLKLEAQQARRLQPLRRKLVPVPTGASSGKRQARRVKT